jgi:Flp pilus assembly protein TadG
MSRSSLPTHRTCCGIHLLDFELFEAPDQAAQALWCFGLRDRRQPHVMLGNELQLNQIERPKADRLGLAQPGLATWVAFFEHWQEEPTMAAIAYPPVQQALDHIKALSADAETQRHTFVRERALHDQVSERRAEREKGRLVGRIEGRLEGSLGQTIGNHHRLARTPRARRFRQLGTAIVEFALTATLSIGLQFAIIEFALGMYNKGILTHAARVGARTASLYWKASDTSIAQMLNPNATTAADDWLKLVISLTETQPETRICRYANGSTESGQNPAPTCSTSNAVPGTTAVSTDDMVVVRTSLNFQGVLTSALIAPFNVSLVSQAVMRVE